MKMLCAIRVGKSLESNYLANVDLSVLVVVVSLHETLFELSQHGIRHDLKRIE